MDFEPTQGIAHGFRDFIVFGPLGAGHCLANASIKTRALHLDSLPASSSNLIPNGTPEGTLNSFARPFCVEGSIALGDTPKQPEVIVPKPDHHGFRSIRIPSFHSISKSKGP